MEPRNRISRIFPPFFPPGLDKVERQAADFFPPLFHFCTKVTSIWCCSNIFSLSPPVPHQALAGIRLLLPLPSIRRLILNAPLPFFFRNFHQNSADAPFFQVSFFLPSCSLQMLVRIGWRIGAAVVVQNSSSPAGAVDIVFFFKDFFPFFPPSPKFRLLRNEKGDVDR